MKKTIVSTILLLLLLSTVAAASAQTLFAAITNVDKVKLLDAPSPSAAVVEVLKLGDVVKVYGKSADGQYWDAEHKNHRGWIKFNQLSPRDHRY